MNQFTSVARPPATPLMFIGNIYSGKENLCLLKSSNHRRVDVSAVLRTSDITTHGTAPIPIENDPMYT